MKKRLSKNFWLHEFTKVEWSRLTVPQQVMFLNLAQNILQPFRDFLDVPIDITNSLRTTKDYHRLIKRGYRPSEKSDHFFGNVVPLRTTKNIKVYGPKYFYTVGASDIRPRMNVYKSFRKLLQLIKNPSAARVDVGQLIYEKDGKREWIHVSNPKTLIFSDKLVSRVLRKAKILKSLNGGRTYTVVK